MFAGHGSLVLELFDQMDEKLSKLALPPRNHGRVKPPDSGLVVRCERRREPSRPHGAALPYLTVITDEAGVTR